MGRAVWSRKGWQVAAVAGLLLGGGGSVVASVADAVSVGASPLALQANHRLAVKPGGGGHGPGGGGSNAGSYGWSSSNWSGYAITGTAPYRTVTSTWMVPTVAATKGASYSAAWVGIDGFNNSSLIQTGTEQDYYRGSSHYAAWWTTSAQGFVEQPIAQTVKAGDSMNATIGATGGTIWTITLADKTQGWTFTNQVTYTGPGASAEWIMEAPTVGGRIASLAHYKTTPFDPGTVNGGSPQLVQIDAGAMIQGRSTVSTPSSPDNDSDGFAVAYGSGAPPPPAS